eukprot:COSAG02_NODE_4636_length_5143_cov_4.342585_2_plen_953_part_00
MARRPYPADMRYGTVPRDSGKLDSDLDSDVEHGRDEGLRLIRTPSVQKDLETGMDETRAAHGQALRAEVRLVDAELVALRHELKRSRLLRGPSGERRKCDADCIIGGCELDKAVEDGILCPGCGLFLCHECFGSLNVAHECAVGGRYDRTVVSPSGKPSEPGSLPCPMFPNGCGVGHIPLVEIQRALLHPRNRGRDGEYEDIDSPGHSPHKLHLLARRRAAERNLAAAGTDSRTQSKLIRTMTEVRHSRAVEMYGVANSLDLGVLLAERNSEREELQKALQLFPPVAQIPPPLKRTCAQCGGVFHANIEGAQCSIQKPQHFLCNLCFGSYLMHACSVGGSYEQEITDDKDQSVVISDRGQVPCPFFRGHGHSGAHVWTTGTGALTCDCGDIGTSVIERVLLDPRNGSAEFFREMNPAGVIRSLEHTLNGSFEPQMWSRETELLGTGACPANLWETARHRHAEQIAAAAQDQAQRSEQNLVGIPEDGDAGALELARKKLVRALDTAGSLRCPHCGARALKDDACIHMDTCRCGSSWCFLCNKESGDGPGQCPRGPGKGGCDEEAMFLQRCPGWENFAIGDESAGMGAQQEFLRRRMAFSARAVKSETPEHIWRQLQQKHADLLSDVPTPGRNIEWDSLDTAEMPVFGSNSSAGDGGTAAQRVQEHWAAMRAQENVHELRRHNRIIRDAHRAILPSVVATFVVVFLLVDASVVMRVSSPPSPVAAFNATTICNSVDDFLRYQTKVRDSDEVLQGCVGASDEDCSHTMLCLFCNSSMSGNTLPDGVPCLYEDHALGSQSDELQTIESPVLHSTLSVLIIFEVGWCFLHWIAALCAWRAARNQPDEAARLRPLPIFISVAPIICVIFYWSLSESADEMLSHSAFVGMIIEPASFVLGNIAFSGLVMWCVDAFVRRNEENLGTCSRQSQFCFSRENTLAELRHLDLHRAPQCRPQSW